MKKISTFFFFGLFVSLSFVSNAQEEVIDTVGEVIGQEKVIDTVRVKITQEVVIDTAGKQIVKGAASGDSVRYETWKTPIIADDMTVDPELNKKWREGKSNYSAKPKNMWELGVHAGHFFIDGDVDRTIPGGWGAGLHLRKALHYVFSIRLDAFYGQAFGLDPQPWKHYTIRDPANEIGGGLVEPVFDAYGGNETDGTWFPSHRTTYMYGAIQGILNIGNLLFHKERNKWNWYLGVGVGLDNNKTELDLLDGNGVPYTDLINRTGYTAEKFDTRDGRIDIKKELRDIYDGDYETEGHKKKGIFRIGDENNIHVVWTGSMGISRKITKRFNIGLEHQVMATDNDYLDGVHFRTSDDVTQNVDISHYTNIRFSFNLGNFNNKVEPLYWMNPMDGAMSDIASLKQRTEFDLTDTDGDGVINIIDLEINSLAGCPVDTRGIVLDSDGDGIPDCLDHEPYSPPGFVININGVAIIPPDSTKLTESDVVNIFNRNVTEAVAGCCTDWFLPMIHFDLDKYCIKPEFYSHMHHVGTVLQQNPDLCVTAQGHTDNRNPNDYNTVLSYNRAKAAIDYIVTNYGISRDRLKLMYGGEDSPLSKGLPDSHRTSKQQEMQHYLNRRVEFRVCQDADIDMPRPEGPEAGNCDEYKPSGNTYSPSPSSPIYRGNKSSGF